MMGEIGMMSDKMKFKSVGCSISDIVSCGTPLADELACFAAGFCN